ncbi:uncharacterized protein BROUX77_000294 [Berkeleyomyces rouxiae]|uniref:uncharacterized protein n=1 Tax=Berkeleyomyces rouxiae TaxID=2035830 RepID=UPI003B7CE5B4
MLCQDTAPLAHDDVSPGFTFRKAANVAGKFGDRPGKRPPILFDAGVPKHTDVFPATTSVRPTVDNTPKQSSGATESVHSSKNQGQQSSRTTDKSSNEGNANPDPPFCIEKPNDMLASGEERAQGIRFPFPDTGKRVSRPVESLLPERKSAEKAPRLPAMSPAFVVPSTDTQKIDDSRLAYSRQSPSIVGDLETTPICKPKLLPGSKSRKAIDSRYTSKPKRYVGASATTRKENLVSSSSFMPRPSSRASNISRRRLNIPQNWFSKSDDEKQLQNVASTLNAWAEHNNHQRTKFNEMINGFEKKIHDLERELGNALAIMKDNEDQIADLEAEKKFIEEHNNDLEKRLEEMEEKVQKQNALINDAEQDSKVMMEHLAQVLDHMGIKDDTADVPERFTRITEAFDDCSNHLAEHQITLAKVERAQEVQTQALEQKEKDLEALKRQYETRAKELCDEIKDKDNQLLSREAKISQLMQKVEDDQSLKEHNENLNVRMGDILNHLTLVLEKVDSGNTSHGEITDTLNSILISVKDRSTELQRDALLQEYLEKFKDVCKRTEDDILASLSDTVSQTTGNRQVQTEQHLQSFLQDQISNITQLIKEHEARLSETMTQTRTEEKLTEHLKDLQNALAEVQDARHATEKELVAKSYHLENALEKAGEAAQLKTENDALRKAHDHLRAQKESFAEEKNRSIEALQHQLMECLSSQGRLEQNLREREQAYSDLQAALTAQENKIAAAEKSLAQAESIRDGVSVNYSTQESVIGSEEIVKLRRELIDSNQRVINLKQKLKKYEAVLQEAYDNLREWENHSKSFISLQEGLNNVGVSSVGAICSRLEAFWKVKSAATAEQSGCSKPQEEVRQTVESAHSLPAAEFDFDIHDEMFPDIDIQDILDSMDHMQSSKSSEKSVESTTEINSSSEQRIQQDVRDDEEIAQLRRIIIKSPGEMKPPTAPTIEEEKVARRMAAAPTSILKLRSSDSMGLGAPHGIICSDSEVLIDAGGDRQTQLRDSCRGLYSRPVISSTPANYGSSVSVSALAAASASASAAASGVSTTDEIRQSLTVSKGVFASSSAANMNRGGKRIREEQEDGAAKNTKSEHISSPGTMWGTKSNYFRSMLGSRSLSCKTSK